MRWEVNFLKPTITLPLETTPALDGSTIFAANMDILQLVSEFKFLKY